MYCTCLLIKGTMAKPADHWCS